MRIGSSMAQTRESGNEESILKTTVGVACGLLVGGGAVLHAQSKPPAFVVAEIAVSDLEGCYEMNFLKPAQKTIADHGGKYLAGGFDKTLSLAGAEPPNRVVLLQFANMDAVKAWRKEGEADLENDVGEKYAKFRVYAIEGIAQ
jgi:uncharacterized protein (DUF1330 family)